MKNVLIIVGIAGSLFLNSCGSDGQGSTGSSEGAFSGSSQELYDAYVPGYSMKDGNPTYDDKSVTLKGTVEGQSFYTNSAGESFYTLNFVEVEGGSEAFPKYGVSAAFAEKGKDGAALEELSDGTEVSFSGTVVSYSGLDKNLIIENCELK